MKFKETFIKDLFLIEMEKFEDERWYFGRNFCRKELEENWIQFDLKQINHSFNKLKWTLRWLHFQNNPKWEPKIVQCIKWKVFYVVCDTRQDSDTFWKWTSFELEEMDWKLIYAWKWLINWFQTMEDNTIMQYYMGEYFYGNLANWIKYNDPLFGINWPLEVTKISQKDLDLNFYKN